VDRLLEDQAWLTAAIARRVADLLRDRPPGTPSAPPCMVFTSGREPTPPLAKALADYGF